MIDDGEWDCKETDYFFVHFYHKTYYSVVVVRKTKSRSVSPVLSKVRQEAYKLPVGERDCQKFCVNSLY